MQCSIIEQDDNAIIRVREVRMQSQLTVRLPDELEREMTSYAKRQHLKRSDVVRIALERLLRESYVKEENSPYKKVSGLIGVVTSGVNDLGSAHREHLLKRIKKNA